MTKAALLEKMKKLPDITRGAYPTVSEIDTEMEHTPIWNLILYFSTDPFGRMGINKKDEQDYKDMVEYTQFLLEDVPDEL